jgi:FkbM family methyltransferase
MDTDAVINELYENPHLPSPDCVALDIGARQNTPRSDNDSIASKNKLEQIHEPLREHYKLNKLNLHMIEADSSEASRLEQEFPEFSVYPSAVWDENGERSLYITKHSGWSSLLEPNNEILQEFNLGDEWHIEEIVDVETTTLNDIFADNVTGFDYIKIDVQGGEYRVLAGGDSLLQESVLIESEVSFRPLYEGSETFSEVYRYLQEKGYILVEVYDDRYNRKDDNFFEIQTSEFGELIHTDALFFNYDLAQDLNSDRLFKSVTLLVAYNKLSLALHIVDCNRRNISDEAYSAYREILTQVKQRIVVNI